MSFGLLPCARIPGPLFFRFRGRIVTLSLSASTREYALTLCMTLSRKSRQLDHFRGLSFSTISSTGANGSVIHYSPAPDGQSAVIDPNQIYLCDSGAQFTDGTTE